MITSDYYNLYTKKQPISIIIITNNLKATQFFRSGWNKLPRANNKVMWFSHSQVREPSRWSDSFRALARASGCEKTCCWPAAISFAKRQIEGSHQTVHLRTIQQVGDEGRVQLTKLKDHERSQNWSLFLTFFDIPGNKKLENGWFCWPVSAERPSDDASTQQPGSAGPLPTVQMRFFALKCPTKQLVAKVTFQILLGVFGNLGLHVASWIACHVAFAEMNREHFCRSFCIHLYPV